MFFGVLDLVDELLAASQVTEVQLDRLLTAAYLRPCFGARIEEQLEDGVRPAAELVERVVAHLPHEVAFLEHLQAVLAAVDLEDRQAVDEHAVERRKLDAQVQLPGVQKVDDLFVVYLEEAARYRCEALEGLGEQTGQDALDESEGVAVFEDVSAEACVVEEGLRLERLEPVGAEDCVRLARARVAVSEQRLAPTSLVLQVAVQKLEGFALVAAAADDSVEREAEESAVMLDDEAVLG